MISKIVALSLIIAGLTSSAFAAEKTVDVSVKGMVCAFCAQGIKKKLSAEEAVNKVDVSLEKHLVALNLKDGKDLSDEKITNILKDAGFTVEKIARK